MYFSKTNQVRENTVTVTSGTALTTNLDDVLDPNFGKVLIITGASMVFELGSVTDATYVALHGVYTNLDGNSVLMSVSIGGNVVGTVTATSDSHSYYFHSDTQLSGTVEVSIVNSINPASQWLFGFCQCGEDTEIPNGGVTGGTRYAYLQNNFESTNTLDKYAAPTNEIKRRVAPDITLNFPNIKNEYVDDELRQVYKLSNTQGVVSVWDEVNRTDELPGTTPPANFSWAAFGLRPTRVSADPRLNKLTTVSMQMKAAL